MAYRRRPHRISLGQSFFSGAGGNGGGGASDGPLTSDPDPIMDNLTFWTEPTALNPENDASGNTTFTTQGSPVLSPSAGPGNQAMLQLDGSSWLNATGSANGITEISSSFWIYALADVPTLSLQGLFGNGGLNSTDAGYYAYIRSDGRLRFQMSDGTTDVAASVGSTTDMNFPDGEPNGYLLQFNLETPGSEFLRVHPNGYTDESGGFDVDLSGLSFPITPANGFAVGNRIGGTGANLPLTGDLMVIMGEGVLTEEHRWFLHNHYRGRTYTEAENKTYLDFIQYVQAGIPANNEFFFSARTDRSISASVYDSSGTLVTSGPNISPVEGYVNSSITGSFTAGQRYEIRYTDASTGNESMHSNFVWALPDDNDIDIITFADWDPSETAGALIYKIPKLRFVEDVTPTYGIMAGDYIYSMTTTNTVEAFRDAMDAELVTGNTWGILSWLPFNDTFSDNDGPYVGSGGVDGDSTSPVLTSAQAFWHARSPIGNRSEQSSGRINWSVDINNIKVIAPDLRSERDEASLIMTSSGVGSTQEWFGDQLDDAITNNQVIIFLSEVGFNGGSDDQSWTSYAQRTDYFNEIASRSPSLVNSGISYVGDYHVYGIDDGTNQGDFDTNTTVRWPSMASGPFNHSFASSAGTGSWSETGPTGNAGGIFGVIEFRNEDDTTIDMTMSIKNTSNATQGSTYTKTLVKPGASFQTSSQRINDDFSSYPTGAGLIAGWTESGTGTNITYNVASGPMFEITKGTADTSNVTVTRDDTDNDDQSVLMSFDVSAGAADVGIKINWDIATDDGYILYVDESANNLILARSDAGVNTNLDTGAITYTLTTKYWMRLSRRPNGEIKGRIWEDGSDEPVTWDVEATGATEYTSGLAGIDCDSTGTYTARIHRFSVGYDGHQGCHLNDADFPTEGVLYGEKGEESIRIMNRDGSDKFVLFKYDDGTDIFQVDTDNATGDVFFTAIVNDDFMRMDRFGTRFSLIGTGYTGLSWMSINPQRQIMYYAIRQASTGSLNYIRFDGGSSVTLRSNINWASEVDFKNGEIYVAALNNSIVVDTEGNLLHTLPADVNGIGIAADSTYVYLGSFSGGQIKRTEIRGSSYTVTDTDTGINISQLSIDPDETEMYGVSDGGNTFYRWTSLPPTTANRELITNLGDPIGMVAFKYS